MNSWLTWPHGEHESFTAMIHATVSEVKNGLSAFLRRVQTGESVLVLDRKTPVACIVPVSQGARAA